MTLARLLRAGELTFIWVPDETHERIETLYVLVRSLRTTCVRHARTSSRFCFAGIGDTKRNAGATGTVSGSRIRLPHPAQQIAFQNDLNAHEQAGARRTELDREIGKLLPRWSLAPIVQALQALRGVAQTVAVALVARRRECPLSWTTKLVALAASMPVFSL